MKTRIVLMTGIAVLFTACTTMDPYTREEKTSSATKGAIIGGVIGAVAGAATGDDAHDRRKRILIGAGAGALAGGAVGGYMDHQEAKLREELEGTGVSVTRDGDHVILNMPAHVTFQTDSSDLNPRFFRVLDSVALVVIEFDKTVIEVAGHTDSTGTRTYNQALSERRASTVATYIHNRSVLADRFLTVGYGLDRPVASNATVEGRQLNRRVEIILVPLT